MHVSGKSVHRQQVGKYGIEIMQKRLDQRFFLNGIWNHIFGRKVLTIFGGELCLEIQKQPPVMFRKRKCS